MLALRGKCDKYIYIFFHQSRQRKKPNTVFDDARRKGDSSFRKEGCCSFASFFLFFLFFVFVFHEKQSTFCQNNWQQPGNDYTVHSPPIFRKIAEVGNLQISFKWIPGVKKVISSSFERLVSVWLCGLAVFTQQVMGAHVGFFVYYSTYVLACQDKYACLQLQ